MDRENLVFFAAIVSVIAGAHWFASSNCTASWADSGMRSRFSLMASCQVEIAPGKWIPAKSYREIEE